MARPAPRAPSTTTVGASNTDQAIGNPVKGLAPPVLLPEAEGPEALALREAEPEAAPSTEDDIAAPEAERTEETAELAAAAAEEVTSAI